MNNITLYQLAVGTALLFIASACGTAYDPVPEEDQREEPKTEKGIPDDSLADNPAVPADGILETVSWNIIFYGDKIHGSEDDDWDPVGPSDEVQQTRNILKIADSLKADLYALQEIHSQQALDDITENMNGYRGFVSDHISWIQKTAFLYNTHTIDSLSSGAITRGQDHYSWANGKFPFYFRFNYMYRGKSHEFYAVVIHAKARAEQSAYQRRKDAARDLYTYLRENKPDAHIILLGDYNDDVDESIYIKDNGEPAESPYQPFVADSNNFRVLTKALSDAGKSSVYNRDYTDMIDHITISDEIFSLYMEGSVSVFKFGDNFMPDYGTTTSDHYPVWAKFDLRRPKTISKSR